MGKLYYNTSTHAVQLIGTGVTINAQVAPTSITFVPAQMFETSTVGNVVGTASAVNTDSGFVWSLTLNPSSRYAIDSASGVVTVASSLVFGSDTITIRVDAGASHFSQSFAISVRLAPTTITDIVLSSTAGFANSLIDTLVGTLSATSGSALINPVWVMTDADSANFKIVGTALYFAVATVTEGNHHIQIRVDADNAAAPFLKGFTLTISATVEAALISSPSPAWIQIGAAMPAMTVTLAGISTAYAVLSTFGEEVDARVSFTTTLPTLTPVHLGTYTIQVYDALTAGVLIGESAPITVWTSASGPASAAITIDTFPSSVTEGDTMVISGTAVTGNNYILVSFTNPFVDFTFYQPTPVNVVTGEWSIAIVSASPYSDAWFDALDPTTGVHVQTSHVSMTPLSPGDPPVLGYVPNQPSIASDRTLLINGARWIGGPNIGLSDGSPYATFTLAITDDAGIVQDITPNYTYITNTTPGSYTIGLTLSAIGQIDIPFTYSFYIPWSVPPTDVTVDFNGTLNDQLPAGWLVGTVSCYTGDGSSGLTFIATEINNNFTIVNDNQLQLTTTLAAGTYQVDIHVTDGSYVFTKRYAIAVSVGILMASSNITFAPSTLTNITAPGAAIGTAVAAGLSGTPVWGLVPQDNGNRLSIDSATGHVTNAKYLSAITGEETATLIVTDGTKTCIKAVLVPVTAPAGPTLQVGAGKTYATIGAALDVFFQDPTGTKANTTIQIFPGTYADDIAANTEAAGFRRDYLVGPIHFLGVLDDDGSRPLITYSEFGAPLATQKGAFVTAGYDCTIENIEVSQVRNNAGGSHNFAAAFHLGDGGGVHLTSLKVVNCVAHDCDMGLLGGLVGARIYIYDTYMGFCGDGSGFSHNLYSSNNSLLHVERSIFHAASIGHLFKSRAVTTEVIDCLLVNSNEGFASACMDIPDGGHLTVSGCTFYHGPNNDRGVAINYGNEQQTHTPVNIAEIDNCAIFNLCPTDYFDLGHNAPFGIENNFDTFRPSYLGPSTMTVTDVTFAGYPSGNEMTGPMVTSGIAFASTIPHWNLALPGTGGNFADPVVGPDFAPGSNHQDILYGIGRVVPTRWSSETIAHTASIGIVVATPTTGEQVFYNIPGNKTTHGPFTYSKIYGPSTLAVASNGTITVNGVLTQNTTITIATDAFASHALTQARVHTGGSGYGVNQQFDVTLTIAGATTVTAAIVNVSSDASGVVTIVNWFTSLGSYTALPVGITDPFDNRFVVIQDNATTNPTGGGSGGTGLTLNVDFGSHNLQLFTVFVT